MSDTSSRWFFYAICGIIIVLQLGDAISTLVALETGLLGEKNRLVVQAASVFGLPIQQVVVLAKILVASGFVLLMLVQKAVPTKNQNLLLFFLLVYYVIVVASNLVWIGAVS